MLGPFLNTIPDGWPFNELERLLQAAAVDPAARAAFWKALLDSTVVVLGETDASGQGQHTLQPGQSLKLRSVALPTGPALAAFTSQQILSRSITGRTSFVALPFRTLADATKNASIVLNPSGPYGSELTPDEIRMALGGVVLGSDHQLEVLRETKVVVCRMADEPVELIDSIVRACESEPLIQGALLACVCMPETGEQPHPLVGLETSDMTRAAAVVGEAVKAWSARNQQFVDIVDCAEKGSLTSGVMSCGRRVYERKAKQKGLWSRLFG